MQAHSYRQTMKRKRFSSQRDLMIATFISKLLLLIIIALNEANAAQPNSFYLSHKIIHKVTPPDGAPDSPSSSTSSGSSSFINNNGQQANNHEAFDTRPSHQQQPYHQHHHRHQEVNLAALGDTFNSDEPSSLTSSADSAGRAPSASALVHSSSSGGGGSSSHNNDDNNNNHHHNNNGDEEPESLDSEHDESTGNYQEMADRNLLLDRHNSRLQAMHDLFERRQLNNHQIQSSQELSPISIGLDPVSGAGSPFNLSPFPVPNHDGPPVGPPHSKPNAAMADADNLDQGLGPALPFGLNPLPHLLGFQNSPFDGPQRGDQSAHSNLRAALPSTDSEVSTNQKVWPKIFRFTDGRINLSDFEKQKKIRLSSKNQHNNENHIESAPIMFDGRQLKRKSFLILHGGIFSK